MNEAILEIDNLTKRYGRRRAVDGLCFRVRRGDIYGFLGRNGAGKSTTIRMILDLVRPNSGSIRVRGEDIRCRRRRRAWPVGAIVESPAFYDYLSARMNLELLASLSGSATKARIDEIVELVGLAGRQHEKVAVYSHGMRQRLGLAQALLPRPELLILDEPLDGLDPNGIRDLRDVMLGVVRERGMTIFMSSHNLAEVEVTCNRVAVIHQGRGVFDGLVRDLVGDSNLVRLRTSGDGGPAAVLDALECVEGFEREGDRWLVRIDHAKVPFLARELVRAELDVLELAPQPRRLEDVFIGLTQSDPDSTGAEDG